MSEQQIGLDFFEALTFQPISLGVAKDRLQQMGVTVKGVKLSTIGGLNVLSIDLPPEMVREESAKEPFLISFQRQVILFKKAGQVLFSEEIVWSGDAVTLRTVHLP